MRKLLSIIVLCLVLVAASGSAEAKKKGDQERARAAVQAGEVLPLPEILRGLRGQIPGRVLDAEMDEVEPGQWLYFIKMLTPEGNVLDVVVDGRSGAVLDVRGGGN